VIHRHRHVSQFPRARSRTAWPAGKQPGRQRDKPPASVKNLIKPFGRLGRWPFLAMTQLRDMPRVAGYLAGKRPDTHPARGHKPLKFVTELAHAARTNHVWLFAVCRHLLPVYLCRGTPSRLRPPNG
jgi:hypothetical protein